MPTPIRLYAPNSVLTILTAGNLNSLSNGSEAEGTFDNGTNLDLMVDLILAIQYNAGPPSAGTKVAEVYLLGQPDGTNYATVGSDGIPQKSLLVAALESRAPSTSALEYLVAYGIPLLPGNNKFRLSNTSGQTLHSSASMFLKGRVYQYQGS